jgi:hypothetical protein
MHQPLVELNMRGLSPPSHRHCEERAARRSNLRSTLAGASDARLLRFARNDGVRSVRELRHRSALKRSAGGAISVTRSRTSVLFGSGATVISRGSSRAVQA